MTAAVVSRDAGLVRYLVIDRPQALNALNGSVLAALGAELDRIEPEGGPRVVVVTGSGDRAFSAGADLEELAGLDAERTSSVLSVGRSLFARIERFPRPIMAAVNGYALGGGFELALACSFMLGSSAARFGLPEASLGLIPGYGGTQRLEREIGRQRALALMLTAEPIKADRAYELGLLAEPPCPADGFAARVEEVAQLVASRGPHALARIQSLAARGDLDAGLQLEAHAADEALLSPEGAEGIAAFRARRAPSFS